MGSKSKGGGGSAAAASPYGSAKQNAEGYYEAGPAPQVYDNGYRGGMMNSFGDFMTAVGAGRGGGGSGGISQAQADAANAANQAAYKQKLAAWRAPSTTGTGKPNTDPTRVANPGYDGGPAIPAVGIPVAAPRTVLAQQMAQPRYYSNYNRYQGGRGGGNPGYGGGSPGSNKGGGSYK